MRNREKTNKITECPNCGAVWDFWYGENFTDDRFLNYYFCSECIEWYESDDGKTLSYRPTSRIRLSLKGDS